MLHKQRNIIKNTVNAKQTAQTNIHTAINTDSELFKAGTVGATAFAGGAGLWAVVCLSSAFHSEGNPVGIAKSLFSSTSDAL